MKGNFGFSLLSALCLGLFVGLGMVHAGEGVKGSAKADKLDACVAPTDFMRRNHFELIKHQRDITVHQGIRETDHSLAGCVDCHVRKDAPPLLLITGDRELEILGRYEETAYLWRMMKVAGHTNTELFELDGFNHGQMAEPAHPLLLRFIQKIVAAESKD